MKVLVLLCILSAAVAFPPAPVRSDAETQRQQVTTVDSTTGAHVSTVTDNTYTQKVPEKVKPNVHEVTEVKPLVYPEVVSQYYPQPAHPFEYPVVNPVYPKPYYPHSFYNFPYHYPGYPASPYDYPTYFSNFFRDFPFLGQYRYPFYKQFEGRPFFKEPVVSERPWYPYVDYPRYSLPDYYRQFSRQYSTPAQTAFHSTLRTPSVTGAEHFPVEHLV